MAVLHDEDTPEPITSERAAQRLRRAPGTIRYWVTHFNARRLGKVGRTMYYDFNDLFVIERELYHRHPVPETWQERAQMRDRCPLPVEGFPAAA